MEGEPSALDDAGNSTELASETRSDQTKKKKGKCAMLSLFKLTPYGGSDQRCTAGKNQFLDGTANCSIGG